MRYLKIYLILTVLCLILPISSRGLGGSQQEKNSEPAEATLYDYTSRKSFPEIFSAYTVPFVPRARLENSRLLSELIADGKLKLSLEDAIVLALENNLDIAVARYDLPIAQTDLLRAKAGGAGGTVLGGGIPSLGAVGCCDPTVSVFYGWDHAVNPLNFTVVSGVPIETTRSADVSGSYSQGFLTGTSIFVNVNGYREASNATTQLFNPFINSGLFVGVNQQLLNGFGYRANAKFIRIARNDQKYALSVFRQNVINTVAKVMTTYYDLLADLENIRVTDEGLQYAKDLLNDNETEAQIGAAAQLDVVRAEEEVAARQQDRLVAGNTFAQDAQSLKAEISKSFNGEIAAVQVEPVDQLPEPHADDIPSLAEALREAAENRPEIEQAQLNLRNQQVTIQAVRNELLPTLDAYAIYTPSGLSGEFGSSFGQLFHGRFPNYAYGLELSIPIRNRTAQADAARALLEQRQLQMKLQQAENQVVWDVSKAVSAVEQAKSQLEAAVKVTALARQTLDMEQTKFKVGQASVEEVINSQRDLATAENNVVKAKTAYAQALIQFEQATGTILKKNHIELTDAVRGDVPRPPQIPGTPAQ